MSGDLAVSSGSNVQPWAVPSDDDTEVTPPAEPERPARTGLPEEDTFERSGSADAPGADAPPTTASDRADRPVLLAYNGPPQGSPALEGRGRDVPAGLPAAEPAAARPTRWTSTSGQADRTRESRARSEEIQRDIQNGRFDVGKVQAALRDGLTLSQISMYDLPPDRLRGATFEGTGGFDGVTFPRNLSDVTFRGVRLSNAHFSDLSSVHFEDTKIRDSTFFGNVRDTTFQGGDIESRRGSNTAFGGSTLNGVTFDGTRIQSGFQGTRLGDTQFRGNTSIGSLAYASIDNAKFGPNARFLPSEGNPQSGAERLPAGFAQRNNGYAPLGDGARALDRVSNLARNPGLAGADGDALRAMAAPGSAFSRLDPSVQTRLASALEQGGPATRYAQMLGTRAFPRLDPSVATAAIDTSTRDMNGVMWTLDNRAFQRLGVDQQRAVFATNGAMDRLTFGLGNNDQFRGASETKQAEMIGTMLDQQAGFQRRFAKASESSWGEPRNALTELERADRFSYPGIGGLKPEVQDSLLTAARQTPALGNIRGIL